MSQESLTFYHRIWQSVTHLQYLTDILGGGSTKREVGGNSSFNPTKKEGVEKGLAMLNEGGGQKVSIQDFPF